MTMFRLPLEALSLGIGWLAELRRPERLARLAARIFAKAYSIDLAGARVPEGGFACVADLFRRELLPGARRIDSGIVSPVDGRVRNAEPIRAGELVQVKGCTYTVRDLIGDEALAREYEDGFVFNLYLAPPDYHHVHSPCSGEIVFWKHIPGRLFPVNDFSLRRVRGLFAVNERVVIGIATPFGMVTVVMVGATNVGKIRLDFAPEHTSRHRPTEPATHHDVRPPRRIESGERLGGFELGSSVLVLLQSHAIASSSISPSDAPVRVGQQIAIVRSK